MRREGAGLAVRAVMMRALSGMKFLCTRNVNQISEYWYTGTQYCTVRVPVRTICTRTTVQVRTEYGREYY